jgi:hypothetical protein
MGADIDAYKGAGALGIQASNAAQYSKGNTRGAYMGMSSMTSRSRDASGPVHGMTLSDDEKKLIEEDPGSKSGN